MQTPEIVIITSEVASLLQTSPRTRVHVGFAGSKETTFHCDATLLEESGSDFLILCLAYCQTGLGRTYYLVSQDSLIKKKASLLDRCIVYRHKDESVDYGYIFSGKFEPEKE